jgi:hypothetical protein
MDNRQAQTSPSTHLLGCKVGVENPLYGVRAHTHARVFHAQPEVLSRSEVRYRGLNEVLSTQVFMSLIHTCQLAGENPFEYLTALLKNSASVARAPADWLPWNFRATLAGMR